MKLIRSDAVELPLTRKWLKDSPLDFSFRRSRAAQMKDERYEVLHTVYWLVIVFAAALSH